MNRTRSRRTLRSRTRECSKRSLTTSATELLRTLLLLAIFAELNVAVVQAAPPPRPLEAAEVAQREPDKLKELIGKAQDQVEVHPRLDGVLIVEARVTPPNDQRVRTVKLEGKIRQPQQRAVLAKLVTEVLLSDSFWSTSDDEFVVSAEVVAITEPNADAGGKSYGAALEHFFRGEYEPAEILWTRSLADAPNREVIHFWKAATHLATKQPERAEKRLEAILRRNPRGSRPHAALFERLQGPLRRELDALEERLLLKVQTAPNP